MIVTEKMIDAALYAFGCEFYDGTNNIPDERSAWRAAIKAALAAREPVTSNLALGKRIVHSLIGCEDDGMAECVAKHIEDELNPEILKTEF